MREMNLEENTKRNRKIFNFSRQNNFQINKSINHLKKK